MDISELLLRKAFARQIIDNGDFTAPQTEREGAVVDALLSAAGETPGCAPPIVRRPSLLPREVKWLDGVAKPIEQPLTSPPPSDAPLPKADCLVITWTRDEHRALARVFTPINPPGDANDYDKWHTYRRDFGTYAGDLRSRAFDLHPAVSSNRLGRFFISKVGSLTVLLFKSELHMNQDGPRAYREGRPLPIVRMIQQLVREVQPRMLISTGTAGGTIETHNLGDTVVSTTGVFHCGDPQDFRNADFNCKKFGIPYWVKETHFEAAAKMMVPIDEYAHGMPHPRYPKTDLVKLPKVDPRIISCPDLPIITTDFFEFGNTVNGLGKVGCAVEMGDALIAKAIDELDTNSKPQYVFVRNVSDPVINGDLDSTLQVMLAVYYYQTFGILTSFNGALATWAVIAGNQ